MFVFHVCCCLSLDSVIYIRTFASLDFYFSKVCCQWIHLTYKFEYYKNNTTYPAAVSYHRFSFLSLYNRHFLSQVRRMRHFSRVSHSFRTSHKMPNSPCLAYRHHLLLLESIRQGNKIHIIKQIDSLNSLLCKHDPTRLN